MVINLEGAKKLEKVEFQSEGRTLLWNTVLFFQYMGYSDNMLYVYIASLYLTNNITVKKINNFLSTTLNVSICEKTIKKHLKKLKLLNYLWEDKFGFQLKNQKTTTLYHTEEYEFDFPKFRTFYDSKIIIHEETFDDFEKSKFKNFKLFIMSEMVCAIYHNEPVSKSRLRKELKLNDNELRVLNRCFHSNYIYTHGEGGNGHSVVHARENREEYRNENKYVATAEWKDDNDYLRNKRVKVSIGTIYTKDRFSTEIKINEHLIKKFNKSLDVNNYVIHDTKESISYEDRARVVEVDGDILLLSRENRTLFGIRNHHSIDSLTGEYTTLRSKTLFPQLATKSYTVSCCQLTRFIGYGKCKELDVDNDTQMLSLFSNLIKSNSIHKKDVLLTRKKDLKKFL